MTPPDTRETCAARLQLAGAGGGWLQCNQEAGHYGDHHAQGDDWHSSWANTGGVEAVPGISDSHRAILLEQVSNRLEQERDLLLHALKRLQGECFCGVGIGDPSLQGRHTDACIAARDVITAVDQAKERYGR